MVYAFSGHGLPVDAARLATMNGKGRLPAQQRALKSGAKASGWRRKAGVVPCQFSHHRCSRLIEAHAIAFCAERGYVESCQFKVLKAAGGFSASVQKSFAKACWEIQR